MSVMRLGLNIVISSSGTGLTVVTSGVKALAAGARVVNAEANALIGTIGRVGASIGIAAAAWKGFDILKGLIAQGLQFNSQMEQSKLGLAAIIGQFAEVREAGSGKILTDFNSQLKVAGILQEKLKTLALQTTAEYTDLVKALQSSLGPALKAFGKESGDILGKVLKFTQNAALAWGAMGRDMSMLPQEMRALLKGEAGPDNELVNMLFSDKLGKGGGLQKYIKELQAAGKFSAELEKRMESFMKVGAFAGNTLAGAWSNLKDAFAQALGQGTQGQLGNITKLVQELTAKVVTFDKQGRATFNKDFVNGIDSVASAFVRLSQKLVGILSHLDDLTTKWKVIRMMSDGYTMGANGPEKMKEANIGKFNFWPQLMQNVTDRTVGANGSGYESMLEWFNAQRVKKEAEERARTRDIGARLFRQMVPEATKLSGITREQMIAELGAMPDKANTAPRVFEAIRKAAKDSIIDVEEFNAALRATSNGGFDVSSKSKGDAADIDKKAEAIRKAIEDYEAAAKIFAEQQAKIASGEGFKARVDADELALRKLTHVRERADAEYDALLAITTNPIKKIEIERKRSLEDLDNSISRFVIEQSKRRAQLQSALDGLGAEEREFGAKQAKELQDFLQKGVRFGSPEYKRVLAAQKVEYGAFAEALTQMRSTLNAELAGLNEEQLEADEAFNAKRVAINVTADADIAAHRQSMQRVLIKQMVDMYEAALEKVRQKFDRFYGAVGDGMRNAFTSALDGGGLRGAFDSFFSTVLSTVGESLSEQVAKWMETLSLMASGQEKYTYIDDDGSQQTGFRPKKYGPKGTLARGGMLALQAGSALYGMYTNPAPKQGQNMLSGAMAGASLGATYGAGIASVYGAIIGAFIGAIAGAFAPTEDGKNVRIHGTAGRVSITGLGGQSEWGADKLTRELNHAVRSTAQKLDAIFLDMPTAVLAALGSWRPDLSKISVEGKADGKNWNEELDNYLREIIPGRVFAAYDGAISGLFKFFGVTDARMTQLTAYLKTLKTDEAIAALKEYADVLGGFFQLFETYFGDGKFGQQTGRRRASGGRGASTADIFTREAYANADRGPMGPLEDISKRIGVLSQGFDALTHEDQVARGKQILGLSQQFFEGVAQYLVQLRDMQRGMNESVDQQIRDIDYDQLKAPKQRVEFVMDEQRRLYDDLGKAKSADEVNRIMARIGQNAQVLYDLLGKNPEAAKTVKQQLEDAREVANKKYTEFTDAAQKMLTDAFTMVDAILRRLGAGLDEVLPPGRPADQPEGPGGGGPGGGPQDPEAPDHRHAYLRDLGIAATAAGAGIQSGFTPSVLDATARVLQFSSALERASTMAPGAGNVTIDNLTVNVELDSDLQPFINGVAARATIAARGQVISNIEGRAVRARVTGR